MNAKYDTTTEKWLCPKCKEELTLVDDSPAYYAFCNDCLDYIYDPDDGLNIGRVNDYNG